MVSTLQLEFRILCPDWVGTVTNVVAVMAENGLSVRSMDMERQGGNALVHMEAIRGASPVDGERLRERLKAVRGVVEVSAASIPAKENRERCFQFVLDNISDGILAIDTAEKVVVINRVAKEILNCRESNVVGRRLSELDLPHTSVLQCLDDKTFANERRNVFAENRRFQFLATGRPIKNRDGRILGALEIMKDLKEIKELANAVALPAQTTFGDMIGQSPAILNTISFAQRIAKTHAIVSIWGESGTGKELFASAIHADSGRRGRFIPVNCAALPENLLESELFGYEEGAFSGAKRRGKSGLFEQAHDGTLFLDEIGEMSLNLQAKMLRVIQEGKIRRLGGTKEVAVNARIITATNKNLAQLVAEGQFREDLFYRVNVFPLHIPPLRERADDIRLLVEHFLFQLDSRVAKPIQSVTPEAFDKLYRHSWPGNVRELRNVIERAAILCNGEQIGKDCIRFAFANGKGASGSTTSAVAASELAGTPNASLSTLIDRYEREIIVEALERTASKRKAAMFLGISHTTLLSKLKKHRINGSAVVHRENSSSTRTSH